MTANPPKYLLLCLDCFRHIAWQWKEPILLKFRLGPACVSAKKNQYHIVLYSLRTGGHLFYHYILILYPQHSRSTFSWKNYGL